MELIHLYTPLEGVRFFGRASSVIKKEMPEKYCLSTWKTSTFLYKLQKNIDEYNDVIIMMHGAEDSFLVPRKKKEQIIHSTKYKRAIDISNACYLKNDFVFAVSCCTAKKFGPKAIEEGALSYLGYDILIEPIFKINYESDQFKYINKRIRMFYQTEIKKIYTDIVSNTIIEFFNEFQTVKILKQTIALRFEKKVNELFNFSAKDIQEKYGWVVDEGLWKKEWPKLKMLQLAIINEINAHFIILGDEGYISLLLLDEKSEISRRAQERLLNAKFYNKAYEKFFVDIVSKWAGKHGK